MKWRKTSGVQFLAELNKELIQAVLGDKNRDLLDEAIR